MTRERRRRREGLTLVETALVICIGGTLLAIFVPTFLRELRTSKTSEAVERLAELHDRTAAYFGSEHVDGHIRRAWCLPDSAGPAPRFPSATPVAYDFHTEQAPGHATWEALGFQPPAVRYRYTLIAEATGCGIRRPPGTVAVTLRAEGDLDQDGIRSTFERGAGIDADGTLVPVGGLFVDAPVE